MKKRHSIIMISMMLISFLFSGVSMAGDDWDISDYSGKHKHGNRGNSIENIITNKIFIDTLSEIPNIDLEKLNENMKKGKLFALLETLDSGLNLDKFKDELIEKYGSAIKTLSSNVVITSKQIEKLNRRYEKQISRQITMVKMIKVAMKEGSIPLKKIEQFIIKKKKD